MTLDVVFEIAEMVLSVVKSQATGKVQEGTAIADTLLELVHKTIHACQQDAGKTPASSGAT